MAWAAESDTDRFPEATDWFLRRLPMTEAEFDADVAHARRMGFWVKGVTDAGVIKEVMQSMEEHLAKGTPFREWADSIGPSLARQWGGADSARVETIIRNWSMRSYNEARWRQQTSPAVKKLRPYGQFDAVRPTTNPSPVCTHWNEKILPIEEFAKRGLQPPLHHRCQSGIRSLTERAAKRLGGVSDDLPKDKAPEGWGKYDDEWVPDKTTAPIKVKKKQKNKTEVIEVPPKKLPVKPPKRPHAPASVDGYKDAGYVGVDKAALDSQEKLFGKVLSPAEMDVLLGVDGFAYATREARVFDAQLYGKGIIVRHVYRDSDGRVILELERGFHPPFSSPTAKQRLLRLDKSMQGTGIGARIVLRQLEEYERLGIRTVTLDAAWVGKYVWARAGFSLGAMAPMKSKLKRWMGRNGFDKQATEAIVSEVRTVQDIALLTTSDGRRFGKEFLLSDSSGDTIKGMSVIVGSPEWEQIKEYMRSRANGRG